jgi:threonine synthase
LTDEKLPPAKPKKTPRPAWTYRGNRKKDARRERRQMLRHAPEVIETVAPAAHINRSENWPRAMTYSYARELSQSKEPVR